MTDLSNFVNPQQNVMLENVKLFNEVTYKLVNRDPSLPGFGLFYGPSGFGKTCAASTTYLRYHCPMIIGTPFMTRKTMMTKILKELQIPFSSGKNIGDLVDLIVEEFRAKTTPLLIIDEADYIVEKGYAEDIRAIHNQVPNLTAIFIGEENLPHMMKTSERLDGRILVRQGAEPCSISDTQLLLDLHCKNIKIHDDLLHELMLKSAGSARRTAENFNKINNVALDNSLEQIDLQQFNELSPYGLSSRDIAKPRKF